MNMKNIFLKKELVVYDIYEVVGSSGKYMKINIETLKKCASLFIQCRKYSTT